MEIQIKGKLFDERQIQQRVRELAEQIERDAQGRRLSSSRHERITRPCRRLDATEDR